MNEFEDNESFRVRLAKVKEEMAKCRKEWTEGDILRAQLEEAREVIEHCTENHNRGVHSAARGYLEKYPK